MKYKAKDNKSINSVAAISPGQELAGPFKGVSIRKNKSGLKLVSSMTASSQPEAFPEFVSDFTRGRKSHVDAIVLGMDLKGASFYRICIPPVKSAQVDAIISMQAETLIPVPLERMRIGYRIDPAQNGKCPVTLAVSGKGQVDRCIEIAENVSADGVILTAEAVAIAWRRLFDNACDDAVLVYIQQDRSLVLNMVSGRLESAVTIEVGHAHIDSQEIESYSESLFTHDLRNAISMFAETCSGKVFVLSPEPGKYDELIKSFTMANIPAQASIPVPGRLKASEDFGTNQIMEYIEPIGACLIAIDPECSHIDFFKAALDRKASNARPDSFKSLITSCLILLVILVLFSIVAKAMDKKSLSRYTSPEIDEMISQQKIRKLVAQKRVDFIEFLAKVEAALPSGMKIKSIFCERGKQISLSSTANSTDQILELQEKLKEQKGITEVNFSPGQMDEKTKKIDFKIMFNYKDYTKKSSGL